MRAVAAAFPMEAMLLPLPSGYLTLLLEVGGSMGEVAAVDEPERGWFGVSWGR